MNVLVVMSDSFRWDHLGVSGAPLPWSRPAGAAEPAVCTPHLDALAAESALFERCYLSSYPTVPCRYDLFSGHCGFPHRGWQPLEGGDVVLSELVAAHGYVPMMIFDTPMLATDAYDYTRGFAGWDFVRGQHADRYVVDPIPTTLPAAPYKLKSVAATHRYLRNTAHRRSENDWMCAQTLTRAMDWLERNRTREDFVLWVDLWDPHEPFDAPDFDLARFVDPAFDGDRIIYPRYGRPGYMSAAELDFVRSSYAAQVSLVDRWLGRLVEKLKALGLDRNTLLVFLSDHGHLFGEHDLQGKPTGPLGNLYEVTTRVPLLIRHPEGLGAGERIGGLAQHTDLLPTVLEFLGVPVPAHVQGTSLWPLVRREVDDVHEYAVSGRHTPSAAEAGAVGDAAGFDGTAGLAACGEPLTVTTRDWAYIRPAAGVGEPELYHLVADPHQHTDVVGDHPDVAAAMHGHLLSFLRGHDCPAGLIARYDGTGGADRGEALLPAETALFCVTAGDLVLAFPRLDEAAECVSPPAGRQRIRELTLADLRDQAPDALVHLQGQYYRTTDLLRA